MIELNDGLFIAPEDVSDIEVPPHADHAIITMKTGRQHRFPAPYRKSIYGAVKELAERIEKAKRGSDET